MPQPVGMADPAAPEDVAAANTDNCWASDPLPQHGHCGVSPARTNVSKRSSQSAQACSRNGIDALRVRR